MSKNLQTRTTEDEKDIPSEETLHLQLQIEWQDHIQTRNQTWKTLQIDAAIFLAVIGADIKLNNPWLLIPLGGVLFVSTIFGIAVTIHHRKVQVQKFQFIYMLEEKLGLLKDGYLSGIKKPDEFKWGNIFDFERMRTPTFILVMHLLLLIFMMIYIVLRIAAVAIS
ncbi:hypothetical protein [Desulfobacter vibrioformis]|uniref:hypothetical protein n=1 Tax=Desulfobacter vibrioformis TaxID=34031 RepID=UPI00055591EE|nr:hypothetical protein [Desulfobacter vibrioformis]